jgi:hypothetical protein
MFVDDRPFIEIKHTSLIDCLFDGGRGLVQLVNIQIYPIWESYIVVTKNIPF